MIKINNNFPSLIKYMGSKTEILDFLEYGINLIHKDNQKICDLFAGSATLSGALRGQCNIISNDIQAYSEILAKTYLSNFDWNGFPSPETLCNMARERVISFKNAFTEFNNAFTYDRDFDLESFNKLEKQQQNLIEYSGFQKYDNYYLFTKYYSGTYWSYDQCIWIDSLRFVADQYRNVEPLYVSIISALMYAMAYNSQSTGHYAQYRDANLNSSMEDILIYRRKNIEDFFIRKLDEIMNWNCALNSNNFETYTVNYDQCLEVLEEGTLVYADPPYGFVHYSRFYHVLETLVKYDYPTVGYKGRYRNDRFQSPFCIRTQVVSAFDKMFRLIRKRKLELVLSYSNSETNTISLSELISRACIVLNNIKDNERIKRVYSHIDEIIDKYLYNPNNMELNEEPQNEYVDIVITDNDFLGYCGYNLIYDIKIVVANHNHSTMGRKEDKCRAVKELLLIAKKSV